MTTDRRRNRRRDNRAAQRYAHAQARQNPENGSYTAHLRNGAESKRRLPLTRSYATHLMEDRYPLTPLRQVILETVGKLEYAEKERIIKEIQRTLPGTKRSTIDHMIEDFELAGVIGHVFNGWGAPIMFAYYLTLYAAHLHLECKRCGRVTEIGLSLDSIRRYYWDERDIDQWSFDPCSQHRTVIGLCEVHRTRQRHPG